MSPILSDLDRHAAMDDVAEWSAGAACSADACSQGRKPCPCPEACRLVPRERLGTPSRPSRLTQALLDPYERAALTAGLAVLGWVLLIAFGAWRSA